ncbi:MAG: SMI1/KNR4 family protein [Fusobacteriaceae bacterium]
MNFKEIEKKIKEKNGIFKGNISISEIEMAQKELFFMFPQEYKTFLEKFGYLCIGANEIHGLGVSGYLNIVTATKEEAITDYIVIQNEGTGFLILLNEMGEVFEYSENIKKKIYDTFYEYLLVEIL